jgi:glutamate racemase
MVKKLEARDTLVKLVEDMVMDVQYAELGNKTKARKEFAEDLVDTIILAVKVNNLISKEKSNE